MIKILRKLSKWLLNEVWIDKRTEISEDKKKYPYGKVNINVTSNTPSERAMKRAVDIINGNAISHVDKDVENNVDVGCPSSRLFSCGNKIYSGFCSAYKVEVYARHKKEHSQKKSKECPLFSLN